MYEQPWAPLHVLCQALRSPPFLGRAWLWQAAWDPRLRSGVLNCSSSELDLEGLLRSCVTGPCFL